MRLLQSRNLPFPPVRPELVWRTTHSSLADQSSDPWVNNTRLSSSRHALSSAATTRVTASPSTAFFYLLRQRNPVMSDQARSAQAATPTPQGLVYHAPGVHKSAMNSSPSVVAIRRPSHRTQSVHRIMHERNTAARPMPPPDSYLARHTQPAVNSTA